MFGYGKILGSNVDPTNPYFVDVSKRVAYDPAKAKKLLAEAGYPNGFDAVFKVAPQYYYTVRSAEVVASQLAKVGIRANIQQIEWGQWLSQVFCLAPCQNPDYDMSIIGHAEAWDIGNFANPKYYFRWDSPEFQKLYADSQVTVDDKAPARALRQDAGDAGRRGPRGLALHAPPSRHDQEGRDRASGRTCPRRCRTSPRWPGRSDAPCSLQRYVVRRVAALAVTLFFVSLLVFVVVRVLPGDPALIILGLEANAGFGGAGAAVAGARPADPGAVRAVGRPRPARRSRPLDPVRPAGRRP